MERLIDLILQTKTVENRKVRVHYWVPENRSVMELICGNYMC